MANLLQPEMPVPSVEPGQSSEQEPASGDLATFTHEWEAAPRSMTNYVERSIAEYWFLRGIRAGELKGLTESTETFRAMAERRGLG